MMKNRNKWLALVAILSVLCAALTPLSVQAMAPDADAPEYYTVNGPDGTVLFLSSVQVWADDEYISADNKHYRVKDVDDGQKTATAEFIGDVEMPDASLWLSQETSLAVQSQNAADKKTAGSENKRIAMYVTHSDESYEPTDGQASETPKGGVYDVANELKKSFEAQGVEVILSENTHLPHDSGAYERSRNTVEELMKQNPVALIDVHRDAIPEEEYATEVNGQEMSKVRLLVGRSNPSSEANKEFAKQIKAVADEKHPGLIKDIFIGKGNYNQEIHPQSILLEMGTHKIEKEKVMESTDYIADAITTVLFGSSAKAAPNQKDGQTQTQQGNNNNNTADQNKAVEQGAIARRNALLRGVLITLGIVIVGFFVFAWISAGSIGGGFKKMRSWGSEMTGGMIKRKEDES